MKTSIIISLIVIVIIISIPKRVQLYSDDFWYWTLENDVDAYSCFDKITHEPLTVSGCGKD